MPDRNNCGAYTKYEGGLCLDCYSKKRNGGKEAPLATTRFEKEGGLGDKERNYRYNMIKGRIAQTLIDGEAVLRADKLFFV